MKNYAKAERLTHVENWKKGTVSRAAYAKSVGIVPTTFYTWIRQAENKGRDFVEIDQKIIPKNIQEMAIEKGSLIIRLPLSIGAKGLQTIFTSLGNLS